MSKILVVGAGFAGAVAARELAEAGHEVLVIDKRNHVAGNAYDYVNEHGIRVHKYGPHLWHTNNEEAHNWFSQFTDWVDYKHYVKAQLPDGRHVPLPINVTTINEVFHVNVGSEYTNFDTAEQFLDAKRVKLDHEPQNSRELIESSVGTELCELFFAPYTKKMWGMDLSELPCGVANRIPTKTDNDPYYFPKDKFQGMPKDGYTAAFEKIFDHPNITISLNTTREDLPQYSGLEMTRIIPGWEDVKFDAVFTSEPIDVYFDCCLGELPWRSIKFHTYSLPIPQALQAPVVNFTHDGPCTRVTEWKQIPGHGDNPYWTTLTFEEPCDYRDNNMERYYPVKTANEVDENRELYKKYRDMAEEAGVHFIGRCGMYVYTDMAPCVSSTLSGIRNFLREQR